MRGYYTPDGFYGLVDGVYTLYATDTDYYEEMKERGA